MDNITTSIKTNINDNKKITTTADNQDLINQKVQINFLQNKPVFDQERLFKEGHLFESSNDPIQQKKDPVLLPATAPKTKLYKPNYWDDKRTDDNVKMMAKIKKKQKKISNLKLQSLVSSHERVAQDIFKTQKEILGLLKDIEINKSKNARSFDETREREIKAAVEEKTAEIYDELLKYIPEGNQKRRQELYKEKEAAQIKQHKYLKRNSIDKILNDAERERELATFYRHQGYDRNKKYFYKPTKFACEGFVFEHEGKKLVNVGRAFMGGTKPMYYFEDRNDPIKDENGKFVGYRRYLYKEAVTCNGRKKPQGALVTEAASKLQRIVCGPYAIPAFAVKDEKGTAIGSFQEMIEQKKSSERIDLFKWQASPDDSLSKEIKDEILREHTLDWLLCNFDTKGENFLHRKSDGHLSSFDKEASFSFIEDDNAQRMSTTYSPHSNDTLYNTVFTEYTKGTLDLDFEPMLERARQLQSMNDDEYIGLFEEMLTQKYKDKTKRQRIKGLILARKNGLVAEYRRFIDELNDKRRNRNTENVVQDLNLDEIYSKYTLKAKVRQKNESEGKEVKQENWSLSDKEMDNITRLLANNANVFKEKSSESLESDLVHRNDALERIKRGDVSKFNHVPAFLKEYYGRMSVEEFFGNDFKETGRIPKLTDEMKNRLKDKLIDPVFRRGLNIMIENHFTDNSGQPVWEDLIRYEHYLNQQMLVSTLEPISEKSKQRILNKFKKKNTIKGFDDGKTMIKNNIPKQRHLAKLLFLTQLGRFDQHDTKNGTTKTRAYKQTTAEAIAHGARLAITLPAGSSKHQNKIYNAWQGKAEDQMYSRFATHEFNRRQVDKSGKMTKPFFETRLKGKNAKNGHYLMGYDEEKPTSYVDNYGMNMSLGGLGRKYNGNDVVDDQGRFAHLYQRFRLGDKTHCGTLLFGMENSAPHGAVNIRKHFGGYDGQSLVGQTHNSRALSHDTSSFLSTKENYGDKIGGREVDLAHVDADVLSNVLTKFDNIYEGLQLKANGKIPDMNARRMLHIINEKLTGERLSANSLYDLIRFLGIEHQEAKKLVGDARSTKDCAYAKDKEDYPESMYTVTYTDIEAGSNDSRIRFFNT